MSKVLVGLENKLLRAASGFKDYNFRRYFIQHVKDDFAKIDTATMAPEAVQSLVASKKKELARMQRMALINALYASHDVIVDHDKPSKIVPKRKKAKQ